MRASIGRVPPERRRAPGVLAGQIDAVEAAGHRVEGEGHPAAARGTTGLGQRGTTPRMTFELGQMSRGMDLGPARPPPPGPRRARCRGRSVAEQLDRPRARRRPPRTRPHARSAGARPRRAPECLRRSARCASLLPRCRRSRGRRRAGAALDHPVDEVQGLVADCCRSAEAEGGRGEAVGLGVRKPVVEGVEHEPEASAKPGQWVGLAMTSMWRVPETELRQRLVAMVASSSGSVDERARPVEVGEELGETAEHRRPSSEGAARWTPWSLAGDIRPASTQPSSGDDLAFGRVIHSMVPVSAGATHYCGPWRSGEAQWLCRRRPIPLDEGRPVLARSREPPPRLPRLVGALITSLTSSPPSPTSPLAHSSRAPATSTSSPTRPTGPACDRLGSCSTPSTAGSATPRPTLRHGHPLPQPEAAAVATEACTSSTG